MLRGTCCCQLSIVCSITPERWRASYGHYGSVGPGGIGVLWESVLTVLIVLMASKVAMPHAAEEREATRILMVCARRAASVLRALCPEKAGAAGDRRCDVECGLQVGYDGGSRHSCRGLEYRG